jgi:hypothetical protein
MIKHLNKIITHRFLGKIKSLFFIFTFNKKSFRYLYSTYNGSWANERSVEIPIIWEKVKNHKSCDVLEVGNVLSHYFDTNHKVVDKYEKSDKVENIDIVNFKSKKMYSLIVSISTLEHVGWDEKNKDPKKIKLAIKKLIGHLKVGGEFWVTLPLGYNHHLDKSLQNNELQFDKLFFIKRLSLFGVWKQISKKVVNQKPKYNFPFPNANVICVGMIKKNK